MVVDREKLDKLRGVLPATSIVEFVTIAHKQIANDESMREFVPVFKCRQLTNSEAEAVKVFMRKSSDSEVTKAECLQVVENCILGWKNLYDVTTGEVVEYSKEKIAMLPEIVLRSIVNDLWQYAGTML
jgi:hypothetical protein